MIEDGYFTWAFRKPGPANKKYNAANRNLCPLLIVDDTRDLRLPYSVSLSECGLSVPSGTALANLFHDLTGKLGAAVLFALTRMVRPPALLLDSVRHVIGPRAHPQMGGAHTRRIIAGMAHITSRRDLYAHHLHHVPMRILRFRGIPR